MMSLVGNVFAVRDDVIKALAGNGFGPDVKERKVLGLDNDVYFYLMWRP